MNTSQIRLALQSEPETKKLFSGVFACDRLPVKISKFPCLLVANTDPASEEGEHWVCYYFDAVGNAEYFDSYGLAPANCDLFKFFQRNGKNHKCNSVQLQGSMSQVCGHWCIAFLLKRSHNQSMETIVRRFNTGEPGGSDLEVGHLVNDAFEIHKMPTRVQDGSGHQQHHQNCCSQIVRQRDCHCHHGCCE